MSTLRRQFGRLVATGAARPALWRYGVGILLPILALAITGLLFSIARAPFFSLFSLAVVIAAVYGGRNSGVAAAATSVLLNLLAIPPRFSLRVSDPESLLRLAVFFVAAASISVLVGVVGDLQQALDVERERLHITLMSIGDCVIATDAHGRVTFLNRVAEQVTGWTSAEAMDRPLEEVFCITNENTRQPVPNPVRKVIETGRIAGLANHTVLMRRDGTEIPIDDSAAPIRDLQGKIVGVVLVFRDVTHERKAQAALLRADKLASVGRLAATIAHELNNPLEAISNLLYLIEGAPDVSAASRTFAQKAQRELERAAHVAKQTLSFARRDEWRAPVELAELVDGVLALYTNKLAAHAIEVVRRYRDNAVAEVSSSAAKQVIANLITNALDASRIEGKLHIRVGTANWGGRARVRLTIADTGSGIATEHLPQIFEPFFSTKRDVGTGLGLWVTKEIVDAHDGCVHIRSRVGKGTVVIVCWPASSKQPGREVAASSSE